MEDGTLREKAIGCVLGSFVGNACGSYYESSPKLLSDEEMGMCMEMPGGGPFNTGPGQITDDCELAICLLWALWQANSDKIEGERVLDIDKIAFNYRSWLTSNPFKTSQTIQKAFQSMDTNQRAYEAKKNASPNSMSNASMMRVTPLAVWASSLDDEQLKRAVVAETEITHGEKITQEATFIYCATIKYLLNNPDEEERAQKAFDYALGLSQSDLANSVNNKSDSCSNWLRMAQLLSTQAQALPDDFLGSRHDCIKFQGFVKDSFILSFYYLHRAAISPGVNIGDVYASTIMKVIK